MTDQPSVIMQLDAIGLVPGPVINVRPVMFVRCVEEKLDVFITTGAVLDADINGMTPIRLRWGGGTPTEESWSRSTDYSAAFAPDPGAFIKQLLAAPDIRFEFHPFDASPSVATFNARGLDRHLSAIEAACPSIREHPPANDSGTGLGPSLDQVFMESVVEERPEVLSGPQLLYPDLLRQAGIQGRVIVQAIVDTSGRAEPQSVKVIESPNPGFDQSARDYVLRALFRPARLHGRAVRVLTLLPIEFKINRR